MHAIFSVHSISLIGIIYKNAFRVRNIGTVSMHGPSMQLYSCADHQNAFEISVCVQRINRCRISYVYNILYTVYVWLLVHVFSSCTNTHTQSYGNIHNTYMHIVHEWDWARIYICMRMLCNGMLDFTLEHWSGGNGRTKKNWTTKQTANKKEEKLATAQRSLLYNINGRS